MQFLPGAIPGCILFCGRALRSLKSRLDYRVIHRLRIRRSLPPTLGTSSTNERVSIVNDRSLPLSPIHYLRLRLLLSSPASLHPLCVVSFSPLHARSFLASLPGALSARSFLKRIPIKRARMSSYVLFTSESVVRDITGTTRGHDARNPCAHASGSARDSIVGRAIC